MLVVSMASLKASTDICAIQTRLERTATTLD